jgi:hypothetical protein
MAEAVIVVEMVGDDGLGAGLEGELDLNIVVV